MIKYRGGTVYPLIITNALDAIEEINDYILVIESDNSSSDQVAIHIATTPASVEKIANHLREVAGVNFPILVSNVPTIQSMRGSSRKKQGYWTGGKNPVQRKYFSKRPFRSAGIPY